MKGCIRYTIGVILLGAWSWAAASDHTSHTVTIKIVGHNRIRIRQRSFDQKGSYLKWDFSGSKKLTMYSTVSQKKIDIVIGPSGYMNIASEWFTPGAINKITGAQLLPEKINNPNNIIKLEQHLVITATDL